MGESYWSDESVTLHLGDCLKVLPGLPDASVDAVVCDPPYGLEFMGREWDTFKPHAARIRKRSERDETPGAAHNTSTSLVARNAPEAYVAGSPFQRWCEAWARECLRVLKPGGHLLAFGGTRTWHRLACGIEDAGFEIRDSIDWIYGSGFPKSLDVSKAIDKHLGATRPVLETIPDRWAGKGDVLQRATQDVRAEAHITTSATAAAAAAEGLGTALKPAHEPIVVGRKPLDGTVAANVLEYGTGALSIARCRVGTEATVRARTPGDFGLVNDDGWQPTPGANGSDSGRWPSNVLLTHSAACEPTGLREVRSDGHHPAARGSGGLSTSGHAGQDGLAERKSGTETVEAWDCVPGCPVAELDQQGGTLTSGANPTRRGSDKFRDAYGDFAGQEACTSQRGTDSGGASRFFPVFKYVAKAASSERPRLKDGTAHPTVKPVDLIAWLVRLVTPPGGLVLDPFAGSGTTAEACIVEGFRCVLVEKDPSSAELIKTRLRKPIQPVMFGMEAS
jgi:DNA modification methylase